MFTAAWYKRAVYQFVQSRGVPVGSTADCGRGAGQPGVPPRR
jgi:hypothetical protein